MSKANDVGDEGAMKISEALKTNNTLVTLNLVGWRGKVNNNCNVYNNYGIGCNVGDSGVRSLTETLKTNTSLTELGLGSDWLIFFKKVRIEEKIIVTRQD